MSNIFRFLICLALLTSFAACGGNPEKDLVKASDILAEGNYAKALSEYQKIAEKYEDNSEVRAKAMYWIANIHLLYLNNLQIALAEFENFVLEFPAHPLALDSYWKIAVIYQDEIKDCRGAILKYQRLIDHFPDAPEAAKAQLAIANCYAQSGDTQQAVIEARYLLNNYPASTLCTKALLFIGDTQYQNGHLKNARETYQELIEKYPSSQTAADAWFALAQVQEDAHEYKKAIESLRQIENTYFNPDTVKHKIKRIEDLMGRNKKQRRKRKSRKN